MIIKCLVCEQPFEKSKVSKRADGALSDMCVPCKNQYNREWRYMNNISDYVPEHAVREEVMKQTLAHYEREFARLEAEGKTVYDID